MWQTRPLLNSGQTASSVSPLAGMWFSLPARVLSPVFLVVTFLPFTSDSLTQMPLKEMHQWDDAPQGAILEITLNINQKTSPVTFFFFFPASKQKHFVLLSCCVCVTQSESVGREPSDPPPPLLQLSTPGRGEFNFTVFYPSSSKFDCLGDSCISFSTRFSLLVFTLRSVVPL